ncbi:MAG: hypothetical protein RR758_10860, partial [Burkholderiaceae bacterium]
MTRPRLLAALPLIAALAACAPDAWQNVRAVEFNAYLDRAQAECQPLWIGPLLMNTLPPLDGMDVYDAWLDSTSRLFYDRITPDQYRSFVLGQWPGARTEASVKCLLAKLPKDRPTAPTG